ncbi:MAG: hypothetical protein COZ18_02900 [Flexibacter sp. CG_4_10_14_3_um_filter_32_15]|nr:MAG: hypothetical protein COZ18_02900 [Flexibacter sp. CG_4_10_14_3_um_filter_32_15]
MTQKKILLIPSWYPTKENSIVGSFFREQAAILIENKEIDIKVLYGIVKEVSFFEFILFLFTKFIKKKLEVSQDFLLQTPDAYHFEVKISKLLSEKQKYAILVRAYAYAYRTLSKQTDWKPDLIHAQSSIDAAIFARDLSIHHIRKPYVVIEHQVFLLHDFSKYKQNLILISLREAQKVGVVSEHQKKMVLMAGADCKPVVIWNLVNENNFYIDKNKVENSNKKPLFTILTITYPSYIKDFQTFFYTIKELSKITKDFRYIIIGNTSFDNLSKANSDLFIQFAKELGIEKLGSFIPYIEREELSTIINTADVFVCTSIAETFGVAAREAMMCGLPVVTTACGGVEDSINSDTGRVAPIQNAEKLANHICYIKENKDSFSSEKIRTFAINQCGKEAFIQKMHDFYTI